MGFKEHNAVYSLSPKFLAKNDRSSNPWPRHFEIKGLADLIGQEPEGVLCPVRALKYYLKRTQDTRGPLDVLWCSVRQPVKPMSKNALAFFIRDVIKDAHSSCDDSNFKLLRVNAHEVRAVATSMAFKKNMVLSDIFSATFWRSQFGVCLTLLARCLGSIRNCFSLGPYIAASATLGTRGNSDPIPFLIVFLWLLGRLLEAVFPILCKLTL